MMQAPEEKAICQYATRIAPGDMAFLERSLGRYVDGEPLAYILGEVDFFDIKIKVNRSVLIPRLESEILVEKALVEVGEEGNLLDLCTGSGVLGLSLKSRRKALNLTLADISSDALDVARENARSNGIDAEIVQSDLLEELGGRRYHYVICNPPYVARKDLSSLESSVANYEPLIALDGGVDGLDFYKRIEVELPQILYPGAKLFFEIGYDQGSSVLAVFENEKWVGQRVLKDYSGHDRFFFLEYVNEE